MNEGIKDAKDIKEENEKEASGLREVLESYKAITLPTITTLKPSTLIAPTFRKGMKQTIVGALTSLMVSEVEGDVVEVIRMGDTIRLVVANDIEGCFVVEIETKIKDLSSEASSGYGIEG